MIFSIAMGADYSFEVKNIEIWEPAFFKHDNLSVATVCSNVVLVLLDNKIRSERTRYVILAGSN